MEKVPYSEMDGYVKAENFNITVTNRGQPYHEHRKAEPDFFVPKKTLAAMNKLKAFGFLDDPENRINFSAKQNGLLSRTIFSVEFTKSNLLSFCLSVSSTAHTVWANDLNNTTNIDMDRFFYEQVARFNKFDFTPENGWGFMYCLDFRTLREYNWTEQQIKDLDKLKSLGLPMNIVPFLLERDYSTDTMESFIGLPTSWIRKIVESATSSNEKEYRHN